MVVLDQRAALEDHIFVGDDSGAQKKRKAVVRRESADTQEYVPYEQKGMDMNVDETENELRFVPSAVGFIGLREPRFKGDGRCQGEGFKCWEIATEVVEENGELRGREPNS